MEQDKRNGKGPVDRQQVGHEPRRPRRGSRRDDVVTYRVRVDISDARLPIWRRLDLASDMFLDELHTVIQNAFGWTDSHLHVFAKGSSVHDREADRYLCPFDAEEGEPGVPEQDIRLDEVLVEVGDTLHYEYDYGDGWEHRLKLEAVTDRAGDDAPAVCVDGRRAGPPEDCGGIGGYEAMLASAATDFDPARFEPAEVNRALSEHTDRSALDD